MKLRHLLSPLFILIACAAFAQTFTPVKDVPAVVQKIIEASKKINTIQCDIEQQKQVAMLTDKAISKGKFYFKRTNMVRIDYTKPTKNLVVMNAGKMMVQDDKKTSKMDMHRSKMFQQLSNIIIGSIDGSLFTGKDFKVSYAESKTQVQVTLKPVSKTLANYLSTIELVLDKKDYTAVSLQMNEPSGDNTLLLFTNKQLNVAVADELFVVK
ncbi:MAG TPA: outer membrane lipoprotein carrier protein LolA [Chitinophagales bacterium]|nr:outer membrane lipoprotein carrier protein LolA [Chitinophagales bacterium]